MIARPYGETAVLVEPGEQHSPVALCRTLVGLGGIRAAIPGARTLLVEYDPSLWTPEAVVSALQSMDTERAHPGSAVEIPVRYDGADLVEVARRTGLDVDEVIRRHSAAAYVVAFCGFAPGFAYLAGLDPALHVPRLDEPRTAVPSGAVAIAGDFSAVYPRRSPGGWRLLGRTDLELWNLDREPPAVLVPGTSVRFVPA
ncbi:MAG: hypothetical protein QOG80_885 [Pseudonocardiales bacterium]|jgi:KipI family sensor histidine kinase inhibitor|nr:hypothetical protein [Pseudonocardiales bacterium]